MIFYTKLPSLMNIQRVRRDLLVCYAWIMYAVLYFFSFSVVWEDIRYTTIISFVFLPQFHFLSKKMFFILCLLSSIVYYFNFFA